MTFGLKQCSPCCACVGPRWNEAVTKGPQAAPLWTWLGLPCGAHRDQLQHDQLAPTGALLECNLGPGWAKLGQAGAFEGSRAGRKLGENLHFDCYFQRFVFALMGFVQGQVAHIVPVVGPTSGPSCACQAQQRAQAAPCWTTFGLKRAHVGAGPTWSHLARVRHKLRPSGLLFGRT